MNARQPNDLGCIAYRVDGSVCRLPASVLDKERGGMVCAFHAPKKVPAVVQNVRRHPS